MVLKIPNKSRSTAIAAFPFGLPPLPRSGEQGLLGRPSGRDKNNITKLLGRKKSEYSKGGGQLQTK